ncbi:MAG: efflux RND transporter periplasmic adaptor subunit [Lewinellaceae bacterium]|nr:efflux RND transporter periplasmic adaptor subunit [Lewinellaceae bacterium]
MMNLKIVVLLFVGMIVMSCKPSESKTNEQKNQPKNGMVKEQKMMEVDGIIARKSTEIPAIHVTGNVLANEEVELKPEVSGRVTGIFFQEGSFVSKGQTLIKLNDDELQAQAAKIGVEMELQKQREDRQKKLLASQAISQEEFDVTTTNVKLLEANLDILQSQIRKTRIVAPFSGIIGLKNISIGSFISPSNTIATLQETNPIKIEFEVPEKYMDDIKKGNTISFVLPNSEKKYTAAVYAKEPKINTSTRTVTIRAKAQNPKQTLVPGGFAEITIEISKPYQSIKIPTVAYIPDIQGAKVYQVKNGKVAATKVVAGIRSEHEIEVDGINEGDTILTSGILQVKPGQVVNVAIKNLEQ